jgi:hypothetical protein
MAAIEHNTDSARCVPTRRKFLGQTVRSVAATAAGAVALLPAGAALAAEGTIDLSAVGADPALAAIWGEYSALDQLWDTDPDDGDWITDRQLELAKQAAAIEARNLADVTVRAKVLAEMLGVDPVDPERALAVSIAKRLEALAAQQPGTA